MLSQMPEQELPRSHIYPAIKNVTIPEPVTSITVTPKTDQP
jgi:hypothetical protein